MKRLILTASLFLGLLSLHSTVMACIVPMPVPEESDLYQAADKRDTKAEAFSMWSCHLQYDRELEQPLLTAKLISLGRIGGKEAAAKIEPFLISEVSYHRELAAFALGLSGVAEVGNKLVVALEKEQDPKVQRALNLAIANVGFSGAVEVLAKTINKPPSPEAANGAMQGLGIFSVFHKDKLTSTDSIDVNAVLKHLNNSKTALTASFLLARVPLLKVVEEGGKQGGKQELSEQERLERELIESELLEVELPNVVNQSSEEKNKYIDEALNVLSKLDVQSQAYLLRALANSENKKVIPTLLTASKSSNAGIKVTAIRGLAKFPANPVAKTGWLTAITSSDQLSQLIALQVVPEQWKDDEEVVKQLSKKLTSRNSWLQAEALAAKTKMAIEGDNAGWYANNWLRSDKVNLQRALVNYYTKQNDPNKLSELSEHPTKIISDGALRARGLRDEPRVRAHPTPKALPPLPAKVRLVTSKGDIVLKLFADTPYTSANFIKLVNQGFYNGTYFSRVIPNFVAQGGENNGDGTGVVGYSIREEISQRSHRVGTVGMATLGKDTGGAQFFINLAPNLHLDHNYTIFAEVELGMDIAMKLEQSDKIVSASLIR